SLFSRHAKWRYSSPAETIWKLRSARDIYTRASVLRGRSDPRPLAGEACGDPRDRTAGGNNKSEDERWHRPHSFEASGVKSEGDQNRRADAGGDRRGSSTWDTEGAREARLPDAKDSEGDELQYQGCAVENEVDGDEALEGKIQRQRPANRAGDDADPWNSTGVGATKCRGEESVFCQRIGQAGEGQGEGAEGAESVNRAGEHDGEGE